jgi:hypothetical protein
MGYTTVRVSLTSGQKESIANAFKTNKPISIRLANYQLEGTDVIDFTKSQYAKYITAKRNKTGLNIKMSKSQVKKMGGSIFSAIIPLLKSLAPKVLGSLGLAAASGAISGATTKAVQGSGKK